MIRASALAIAFLQVGMCATGHAQFQTYSSWERQPPSYRAGYVAGALDFYWTLAKSLGNQQIESRAKRIYECVMRANVTDKQISDNLPTFTAAKPALQSGTTISALIEYLGAFCGIESDDHP